MSATDDTERFPSNGDCWRTDRRWRGFGSARTQCPSDIANDYGHGSGGGWPCRGVAPRARSWGRRQDHRHQSGHTDRAAAAEKAATKKSFTSEKLTWVNLLMMDHRQQPVARFVGIAIAQTINEDTKVSKTSDRVIADRLGLSVRTVFTSRQALRDGEWLAWHKPDPRAANRTKLVLTEKNIRSVEDHQIALKDQRDFEAAEGRRRWPKS